ncbi:uncharacterized protein [Euwallacea similis]|uniref:uncharacterized protein n=1 Tax=Euwallacea similis TaxID=1736056 RepID=UPI00344B75D6
MLCRGHDQLSSGTSHFGPSSGSVTWMQMSESSLPRASPSPSVTSGTGKTQAGPRGTGVRKQILRVHPFSAIAARPLSHEALEKKDMEQKLKLNKQTKQTLGSTNEKLHGNDKHTEKNMQTLTIRLRQTKVAQDGEERKTSEVKRSMQQNGEHLSSRRTRRNSTNGEIGKKKEKLDTFMNEEKAEKNRMTPAVIILKEALEKIKLLSKELEGKIENNTHREVKDISKKLSRQAEILNREIVTTWLQQQEHEKEGKRTHDAEIQTENEGKITNGGKCQKCQKENEEEIVTAEGIANYEQFRIVGEMKWKETAYRNTEVKVGNPLDTNMSVVKVVMVEAEDKNMEKGIQALYKRRHPELLEGEEEYEVIEQIYNFKTKTREKKRGQKIIRIQLNKDEGALWENLVKLKKETINEESIAMHHVNGMNTTKLRRMIETVFCGTKVKIVIYTTTQRQELDGRDNIGKELGPVGKDATRLNKKKTYALIVEGQQGEDIKEKINKIKESVKNKDGNREIQGLRTTKEGKILVTLGRQAECAKEIGKVIENHTNARVRIMGPNMKKTTIHIRGMDATSNREEVLEAIGERLGGLREDEYNLGQMRKNLSDTQAVTLKMTEGKAAKLLEHPYIRVGYVRCRMEKRIEIGRCYKCWGLDDKISDCRGKDRSRCCFKYGEEGHRQTECQGEERCSLCNVVGHRTGKSKCEAFRKALSIARGREKRGGVEEGASQEEGTSKTRG